MTETQTTHSDQLQELYNGVAWVRSHLSHYLESGQVQRDHPPPPVSRLASLSQRLGLSSFEAKIVLLCGAMELDPHGATLCAQMMGNPDHSYPTLALALMLFPDAAWDVLSPQCPLLRWQVVKLDATLGLTRARLTLDPRILCDLLGVPAFDRALAPWIHPLSLETIALPPSQQAIADQVIPVWRSGQYPLVQLCGTDRQAKRAIALTIAQTLGLQIYQLPISNLSSDRDTLTTLKQQWLREAILSQAILLIDADAQTQPEQKIAIASFVAGLPVPLILSNQSRQPLNETSLTFELRPLPYREKRQLWHTYLGDRAADLNGHLDPLVAQFSLNSHTIQAACAAVQDVPSPDLSDRLWHYCRTQARPQLDHLAQRIHCTATWDDLVLPDRERTILRDIATHVKQRAKVYEKWGFAAKSVRGLGITALFAGASGTGKTMAAEVLAQEFQLDLYRIDLSAVSSKYIGETEKNLRQIFDAAEAGSAVLLFDEADALFGKRTQVKDSHDRHANLEVSYLLQRMESYQGLAILTTNLRDSLDQAFVRRLRFMLTFPFPKAEHRYAIWQRIFPPQTPTQALDYDELAQLEVAGGNIRAIALNAAFVAAEAHEPIQMKHLLKAVRVEYLKIGQPLTNIDLEVWLDPENVTASAS
ncbi:ATP-binding protein [Spirulina major CS-329]|uniref:ATP-binding protein n=1 Tax=Spirulina TaxID=1154 RepID=UPI00232E985C|nr:MULTISPECIES: ATP-binding protein [Spirulina]MDB9494043.1 ATP-binding protein [Spirulina subsalsa CS-330]MDB9504440.1 ATP-binding protein [Spirulina major CS-329]